MTRTANIETRRLTTPGRVAGTIEYRRAARNAEGLGVVEGYAAVFYRVGERGTEYELLPGMLERIAPSAFDRAVREKQDVRALLNHAADNILGRVSAGTLRLSVDKIGLRYTIDLPDTTAGRDVLESIRRKDITGSSFSFDVVNERFRQEGNNQIRELLELNLHDVGPVTFPAYKATTSDARDRPTGEHPPATVAPVSVLDRQLALRARRRQAELPTIADRMVQLRMRRRLHGLVQRKQREAERIMLLNAPPLSDRRRQLNARLNRLALEFARGNS